jgi:hypothetical protein
MNGAGFAVSLVWFAKAVSALTLILRDAMAGISPAIRLYSADGTS